MPVTIQWKIGDPCANCGGPMPLVPRPPLERKRAAADPVNGVAISQRWDTAPDHQIDELGDLYRCDRCDSKVRVKPAPPAAPAADAPA
jgi:hypothetical protein